MDLKGRLLGNRYEIIENIGNGGMAMVYKSKDHVLNRYVAVKILRDEFTTDEEFIKRFSIEAQSAASITHPNIVSIYDVGQDGNLYYIVMELIKGKTLKEIIIEEGGALPWKWSTNIAIQIASALETAHKNNIVHRDIKPHNIIITEDGVAKVTDFGIAKAVSNSTITAFGSTIGSVHYFSPEHARGGYTDAKSDLYSLGVVLYEMLTGKVPFDADTPVSVALKHMQEEPTPPIEINNKIPPAINDIILKAMRKDTSLRYQNATEMLNDLNRALKEPEGNFVDNKSYEEIEATKKIPTLNNEEIRKEKAKKKSFIEEHRKLTLGFGVLTLFFLSLGITMLIANLSQPKITKLPNLVGISQKEAETKLNESKLTLGNITEEYNSEYEKGYVISQEPEYKENKEVEQETKVNLKVSLGVEETTIPKVVGESKDDAIKALEDAKLKYEVIEEESKKVEAGFVIKQDKEANETVNAGETVTITVSKGIKKVEIPNVIGKAESDAKTELEKLNIKVNIVNDEDRTKDKGVVLKQSVDVGKEVEEGSSITLTINQIAESRTANININIKSLLDGKYPKETVTVDKLDQNGNVILDENGKKVTTTEEKVKDVKVKVMAGTDTKYNDKVDPTTTNLMVSITGRGTVEVKVYIDDILYNTTPINLSEATNGVTIEKRN